LPPSSSDAWFRPRDDGIAVSVLAAPKASRDGIDGLVDGTHGKALKVRVTAVPDNGKANQAIVKLLAETWRLPASALTVAAGATSRYKTIHVAGDPAALKSQLTEWAKTHG